MAENFRNDKLTLDCFLRVMEQFPARPARLRRVLHSTNTAVHDGEPIYHVPTLDSSVGGLEHHYMNFGTSNPHAPDVPQQSDHQHELFPHAAEQDSAQHDQSFAPQDEDTVFAPPIQELSNKVGSSSCQSNSSATAHAAKSRRAKRRKLPASQLALVRRVTLDFEGLAEVAPCPDAQQQLFDTDPIEDSQPSASLARTSEHPEPATEKVRMDRAMDRLQSTASTKKWWKSSTAGHFKPQRRSKKMSKPRHCQQVPPDDGFLGSELQVSPKRVKRKTTRKRNRGRANRKLQLAKGDLPLPSGRFDEEGIVHERVGVVGELRFSCPLLFGRAKETPPKRPDDTVSFARRASDSSVQCSRTAASDMRMTDEVVFYQLSGITAPPRRDSDSGSEEEVEDDASQTDWDDSQA